MVVRIFGMEFGGRSPGAYPSQRENCLLACAYKYGRAARPMEMATKVLAA